MVNCNALNKILAEAVKEDKYTGQEAAAKADMSEETFVGEVHKLGK